MKQGIRTTLRRFAPQDAEPFHAYRSDPEVARYQDWDPMTRQQAEGCVAEMATIESLLRPGHWTQIAVVDAEHILLGDIGLYLSADESFVEMGISLASTAQGRGHGTEALRLALDFVWETTKVAMVWAITDVRNHKSRMLIERLDLRFDRREEKDGLVELFYFMRRPS